MLDFLNDLLWGKVLIIVLVAVGLLFTISSRFVQFRYFGQMFAILGQATHHEAGHLSSFQALVLSVAGRVGAGNIAGVAVAITLGGPGAVFWMWVIGLIGMSTSFFECTLAQLFKNAEPDGTYRGGPAYYINRGLGKWWLSSLFSALLLVTFGFGFNALQSYTVATSLNDTFGVPTQITGVILLVVLALVIFGGIQRIAEVAEFVVPIMAVGYFAMALYVIFTNLGSIPGVLALIFNSAFGLDQAIGGGIGAAIIFGVKRGLFSNEAGLGSAPNVAAVAYVKHPVNQGIVQAFSVFIDTIVLCSCTAAIILLSTVYEPGRDVGGVTMTQSAMAGYVGEWGRAFVTIALVLFAFTSMIYNYYLGENSLNFFSEENKILFNGFRILTLSLVVWGASQDLTTVFGFADVTMGFLALVNLVALVLLFKVGLKVMRDFDLQIQ
ncbi:MAG: alanine/glycine:cation symporter family protein, partial [Leptolyngbyaceae cyanobacterium MO_188.B28]|nr:alanine/glycine:cation symporter family protein [Leptolyngbyaceae cyanobacterium MO_188.B28]